MTSLLVIFCLLGIGLFLVVYGTVAKNRWGINLGSVSCPRCKTPLPKMRKPQSIREAMWGGANCTACGLEVDKWGREVVPQTNSQL